MSFIILIAKIIYALIPVVWTIFFYIYIKSKHDKCENILTFLSVIIFMWGFIDCISCGLTMLGID